MKTTNIAKSIKKPIYFVEIRKKTYIQTVDFSHFSIIENL